jgi:hypothetical protein
MLLMAMKSPFPGMDPYVEPYWPDIHLSLVIFARQSLNGSLPEDLAARADDRAYDELPTGRDYANDPVKEHFLGIIEPQSERLVTVIEFLSPANKQPGHAGNAAYLESRRQYLAAGANLVEFDLTRGGDWQSLLRPHSVPDWHRTDYRACVRRATQTGKVEFYPIALRQRLPTISVPLRSNDSDASLDLQHLFERAYESGRYASTDYRKSCEPPLDGEDAAWADQLLREAGLR